MEISRRDFLRLALASGVVLGAEILGLTVLLTGKQRFKITDLGDSDGEEKIAVGSVEALNRRFDLKKLNPRLYEYLCDDEQEGEFVWEAVAYREKLGLLGFPLELVDYDPLTADERWELAPREFVNQLPAANWKVGELMREFLLTVLGKDAPRLVHKVAIAQDGASLSFVQSDESRFVELPLFYSPLDPTTFVLDLGHEAIGHPVDSVHGQYPAKKHFRVVAAKWQMLSQAFEIKGQFFNHPDDDVRPKLFAALGKAAGWEYIHNGDFSSLPGAARVAQKIFATRDERGQTFLPIYFNKSFCLRLGEKLFGEVRKAETFLQPTYEATLDWALGEIFAEMMKWSLVPATIFLPGETGNRTTVSDIQANPVLTDGVEKILALLHEKKVDINQIRVQIAAFQGNYGRPRQETAELQDQRLAPPTTNTTVSGREEKTTIALSYTENTLGNNLSFDFATLPLDQKEREDLETYFALYERARRKYPGAGENHNNPPASAQAFDLADRHVWEIEKIDEAMNRTNIFNFFAAVVDKTDLSDFVALFRENIPVLQNFLQRVEFDQGG